MMKVIQFQNSTDSAGRAALKLHRAFLEVKIESKILSLHYDINDPADVIHPGRLSKALSWVDSKFQNFITRNNFRKFGLFSFPFLGTDASRIAEVKNADIIYFHWVQGGFLNLRNMRQIAKLGKPVVIFMHDMWSITGGCHHSFSCDKYKSRCFDCQMFPKKSRPDWPALEFRKKKKLYSDYGNLFFVSPSKWLANCTQQSLLTREKPVFNIPNVIDAKFFKSIDKKIARDIINLNTEEYVLAFGAVSINSPYKGWTELQKALKTLSGDRTFKRITILIFGSGYNKEIEDGIPFKTVFMGFLKDEYSTSLVYNAADIFVTPSLADNLPTTILESLSCGTPVVGFDIGGIPDMIRHKENGYLAKYKDSGDIANGIRYCLNNKIKGYLLPEFAKDTIVRQHIDLMNFCKIKLNNQSGNDKEF